MVAPHARHVADRWHLLTNVRDITERWLTSVYTRLRRLPATPDTPTAAKTSAETSPSLPLRRDRTFPASANERQRSVDVGARRHALYDAVQRHHAAGAPIMRISRELRVAIAPHGVVRQFVAATDCAARAPHCGQRSILDPHLPHLPPHARAPRRRL